MITTKEKNEIELILSKSLIEFGDYVIKLSPEKRDEARMYMGSLLKTLAYSKF